MKFLFFRSWLAAVPLLLVGCLTPQTDVTSSSFREVWQVPPEVQALYGPVLDEPYPLSAVDLSEIDPKFWRQQVDYDTIHPSGTLVIDTQERFLYLIGEKGKALRYGIGVGKAGLEFEGVGVIQHKRRWPYWTPTVAMMEREPERYGHLGKGLPPGPDNPLGARALYLFKNGKDTLFRIHGSHESWSIGQAISSGCIRLLNQDIIDLYDRVPNGARVVVLKNDQNLLSSSEMGDDRSAISSSKSLESSQSSSSLRQPVATSKSESPKRKRESLVSKSKPSGSKHEAPVSEGTPSMSEGSEPSGRSRSSQTVDSDDLF